MPFLRPLVIINIFCLFMLSSGAQPPGWKSGKYGKISFNYPPAWQMTRESQGQRTRVTLTPDSMQTMSTKMFEISEIPLDNTHTFADFKPYIASVFSENKEVEGKVLKIEEISFKGHRCIYLDVVQNKLPNKVYGIDAGNVIYLVMIYPRRYIKIADPAMERDETAILNSFIVDQ
jgi:hypothetical protein